MKKIENCMVSFYVFLCTLRTHDTIMLLTITPLSMKRTTVGKDYESTKKVTIRRDREIVIQQRYTTEIHHKEYFYPTSCQKEKNKISLELQSLLLFLKLPTHPRVIRSRHRREDRNVAVFDPAFFV